MAIGKNIKGITIEFNGDTTKLGEALNKIEKKTKGIDSELKSVNRALRFNPGNVELLEQKQKILNTRIGETKKQLEALRTTQAKMDEDPSVDKNSQDYRELRREIIETESKLKHFEGQLQKTGDELKKIDSYDFKKLGGQFEKVGSKMQSVGKGMTKYVTGPIVGVGAASIKSFNEVKDGLNIVAQKTGATGEALKQMQDQARDLAKELPTDFATAGTAIGEVNTRFGVTGDELEKLSGQFVKFAKVNDTDVNTSIDETQKALSAFGLGADDAGHVLDTLTKVGQNTGVSMDSLTAGLIQNGTAFQELGLNIDQAAVLMGQMEKSGANSETVMQGLRKALKQATEDGIPLDEALANLQDTIENGTGSMDGLTAAYDLFGKSGDQIYGAVKNGTLDFKDLAGAAEDMGGTLDRTFEETLTPAEKFQTTLNTMKDAGYEIGNTIMEMAAPAMEIIAEKVQELAKWWHNLSPEMQQFIIKAAMIAAVAGPILTVIGGMVDKIGFLITKLPKLINGFKMVGTAFKTLTGILTANPWMLVAAAAIAAIILIVKNWDKIKEFFANLWKKMEIVASAAWRAIKDAIITPIKNAVDALKGFLETILLRFMYYKNILPMRVRAIFTSVKNMITAPIREARDALKGVLQGIMLKFLYYKNLLPLRVKAIFNNVKNAITAPIRAARDKVKEIIDKIKDFFNFKVHLPHIKLPHFSISPKGWQLGDLLDGVIPSLGIEWYAKGGIFTSPTIIGNKGFGEAGAEAALPLDLLWDQMADMFSNMADRIVDGVNASGGMDGAVITTNVILDGKVVGRAVTPVVNNGLYDRSVLDRRRA